MTLDTIRQVQKWACWNDTWHHQTSSKMGLLKWHWTPSNRQVQKWDCWNDTGHHQTNKFKNGIAEMTLDTIKQTSSKMGLLEWHGTLLKSWEQNLVSCHFRPNLSEKRTQHVNNQFLIENSCYWLFFYKQWQHLWTRRESHFRKWMSSG